MSLLDDITRLLGGPRTNHHEDLLSSLLVMAWMVEARDPYTGGHLWRVSRYARLLAEAAGLPARDVARIGLGAFLHDLGKIGIPDAILNKKDRLTDEEYDIIKTHPEVGWRTLAGHPLAALAESAIRDHHETPDGRGYPRGLGGGDIPVDARIVGICDAFDAMTSTRPYRRGMPPGKSLDFIEENLDRQFDRHFGMQFIALGRRGGLDHILGHTDEGIPLLECAACGPTIVMRRTQAPGSLLYCRCCTGEYALASDDDAGPALQPTGRLGTPSQLEAEADLPLISHLVRESARALLR